MAVSIYQHIGGVMNDGLLIVERIVLEALNMKRLSPTDLASDTGLDQKLVENILSNFLDHNVVLYEQGFYKINELTKQKWLSHFNAQGHIKDEARELFVSLVNQYYKELNLTGKSNYLLNLRKISFSPQELLIFNSYLEKIEQFITTVEKKERINPDNENKTGEKKVVIWGHGDYSSLVNCTLDAI